MGEVRLAPKKANKNKHLPVSASARFRPGRADLIQSERLSQNTNEEFESLFFLNIRPLSEPTPPPWAKTPVENVVTGTVGLPSAARSR